MGNENAPKIDTDSEIADQDDLKPETNHTMTEDADPTRDPEDQLDEAKKEAAESYERFLRVAADFENYKKRTSREMDELRKYAKESLLKDLLPIVDNLERAIQSSNDNPVKVESILEGVEMTLKDILKILGRYQVEPIESVGKLFDPVFHQAFMTEENEEHPTNTVLREFQKGYLLHDRLLRPSMVVVSKPSNPEPSEAPEKSAEENE